jgi:hypothetical protein
MLNLRERWGAGVVVALLGAAVGGLGGCQPEPGLTVTVIAPVDAVRPDHLTVTWLSGARTLVAGQRVPATGELPAFGPLATIHVSLNAADPGERKILVNGVSNGHSSSVGALRVPAMARPGEALSVVLHQRLPDSDEDGLPDIIDDCHGAMPAPPCGSPLPDAGPEVSQPTAGGADGGASADGQAGSADAAAAPDSRPVSPDATPPLPVDAAPALPDALPPTPDTAPLPPDAGPDVASPPPPELVAAWHFEEGSGTAVADRSRHANNGVIKHPTGADWAVGHTGKALSCDGTNWLATSTSQSYDAIRSSLTLAGWVYWAGPSATAQTVVGRQRTGFDNAFWLGLNDAVVRFTVNDHALEAPAAPLATDRWTHLAATYDGARMTIYVGGAEVARQAATPPLPTSSSGVTVGADVNGSDPDVADRFFRGRLDEVVVYSRALSAAEVAALAK